MRTLRVPVFIGVMKGTENTDDPYITVNDAPYTGDAFNHYHWFRTTAAIPIQGDVVDVHTDALKSYEEGE